MANTYGKQRKITVEDMAAIALSSEVNAVYGTTATKLLKPAGASALVMIADKGTWRVRLGDFVSSGMPAAALPTATITNGSGGVPIFEGKQLVLPGPDAVTVVGYAADSALTYYWV